MKKRARRRTAKTRSAKEKRYSCEVCGLAVTVDNICSCIDTCDIVCCGEQMKSNR